MRGSRAFVAGVLGHWLASMVAAGWALYSFKPFRIGAGSPELTSRVAEWVFALLSAPTIPLLKWGLKWQLTQGTDLLWLAAALLLNALLWAAVLTGLARGWRRL